MGEGESNNPTKVKKLPLSMNLIGGYYLAEGIIFLIIIMIVSLAFYRSELFRFTAENFLLNVIMAVAIIIGLCQIVFSLKLLQGDKFGWYVIFALTILHLFSFYLPAFLILWKLYEHRALFLNEDISLFKLDNEKSNTKPQTV